MMRALAIAAFVAAPLVAHADPEDLGTPLPAPSALPAMARLSAYVMSLDYVDVPAMPTIVVGERVTTPSRATSFAGATLRSYVGGGAVGRFDFYSLGVALAYGLGGDATKSFTANGATYTNGDVRMFSIELPSPGMGYRARTWLVSAQLVPSIQWFTESFVRDGMAVDGRDHSYVLSADVQACLQYNFVGVFPKNSAACVYVAPVVYREGWFEGASVGVRWFPF